MNVTKAKTLSTIDAEHLRRAHGLEFVRAVSKPPLTLLTVQNAGLEYFKRAELYSFPLEGGRSKHPPHNAREITSFMISLVPP